MSEENQERGDQSLDDVIIGTVVRDGPITAEAVADKLVAEGRTEAREDIVALVIALEDTEGRIDKNDAGLYIGV